MNLTEKNIEVLKSLASVNEQIWFSSSSIGVSSNDKQIIAYYDYGVTIQIPNSQETGFGIFNLNELLSIIELYDNPTIIEQTDHLLIKEGVSKNKYRYTAKNCITVPPSMSQLFKAKIQPAISKFELSEKEIKTIIKQSVILKSPHIKFDNSNILSTDIDNTSTNTYTYKIAQVTATGKQTFPELTIMAEKFQKIILGDYDVELNGQTVVLKNKSGDITYIIVGIV